MRRAPGWIVLAGIGLELGVLAFLARAVYSRSAPNGRRLRLRSAILRHAQDDNVPAQNDDGRGGFDPLDFIKESADGDTQYYRAYDERGAQLYAAFYADGRVRLADETHRFAGMVRNGRAELLDIENNAWSELFLSVTPLGQMQLELRGGPYDARVLTCDKVTAV